ncbi:hemagglutinin/amebocyte aggregation factor-like isoform X1 [Megalobrama amblycephala]|uniref:hemagglutinin/amebocyte aggregation factor-like isoform X1 n=1 Tax=Megalobrama amblycephala TaxID=75352 RepID=UPI0020147474|nr:hemagglutinin/amebocyte aggregation factor-like isoform X1 [Megalobrama amblycephala]
MRRAALFLLLTSLLANGQDSTELRWENSYDQPLDFKCPPGQSISYIKSEHHNHHEDRLWEFGCKDTFDSGSDCFLSPYANDFDQPLNFVCPPHHIMAGMSSYHNNKHEDRRWQFYCCRSNGHCTANCEWTTYVNWFDEYFHWNVPNQNYLVGAESYHENKHEDRRWKYMYCTKVQC